MISFHAGVLAVAAAYFSDVQTICAWYCALGGGEYLISGLVLWCQHEQDPSAQSSRAVARVLESMQNPYARRILPVLCCSCGVLLQQHLLHYDVPIALRWVVFLSCRGYDFSGLEKPEKSFGWVLLRFCQLLAPLVLLEAVLESTVDLTSAQMQQGYMDLDEEQEQGGRGRGGLKASVVVAPDLLSAWGMWWQP